MAEELIITATASRAEKYHELIPQVRALTEGETDLIANLANTMAALKQTFNFFWVGVYIVKNNELVLGPFQGPLACTRIKPGKGVCGTAWNKKESILVPDVEAFPGHITCSSLSKSEIVVPVMVKGEVVMVIDVDSDKLNDFTDDDIVGVEAIADIIARWYS
jgi:L-methionine (R)-S-oxide reductase